MQTTRIKKGKFFNNTGSKGTSQFNTAKKYAISCDAASSEYAVMVPSATPGFITTGDFSFTMSFRYNDGIGSAGPFAITTGFSSRIHGTTGTLRINMGDGVNMAQFDTNNNVGDGEWHTIIISCDRDGDLDYYEDYDPISMTGYTESVDISSVTGSIEDSSAAPGSNNWYFGFDGAARYSGIDIDQIAFWDEKQTGITAAIMYISMKRGLEFTSMGVVDPPICYWKCNEGTGITVANAGSEVDKLDLYFTPTWIHDGIM